MGESDTLLNAVIGAVVTIVTSFLPFSPVLGGAVAGYLQGGDRGEGARVGAISGALSLLPVLFFTLLFLLFVTGAAAFEGAAAFGVMLLIVGSLAAAYTIGLGALGGYVGVYVLEETDVGRDVDRDGFDARRDEIPGRARTHDERWGDDGRSDERTDRSGNGWNREEDADFGRDERRNREY